MAKTLTETALTTPTARGKLAPGLYWREIESGVHLGYRKGKRGGVWLVRWRNGKGYRQGAIGAADDNLKEGTLDFPAATRAARVEVDKQRRQVAAETEGSPLTVRSAVDEYVNARDDRESRRAGRPIRSDAHQRLSRYVTGQAPRGKRKEIAPAPLAEVPLHDLDRRALQNWRDGLPEQMKATTRQRLVNDLKAALNRAYATNDRRLPPTLPGEVKQGLRADEQPEGADPVARDGQILSDGEISRLLGAARVVDAAQEWNGDLFRLVLVLSATGARFSQVARMRVGDCQIETRRLLVPTSRKGRNRASGSLTIPVGQDVIDALKPAVADRPPDAPLLERWRNDRVAGSIMWQRGQRGPWRVAAELARPWNAIAAQADMAHVIPYALRHSSIVRGIRANLPIRLVAGMHDTSTAMIERHYAKFITSGLEDVARRAIVPLVPPSEDA